jgi:hypothetical protein
MTRPERVAADRGNGPVVIPIEALGHSRPSRSFDEHLTVRFPSLYRASAALVVRFLRPETWVRRWFLRHAVVSGWAAVQRRDFELMLVRYAPDVVLEADAGFQALGVPGSARGRGGMAHAMVEILDVWDRLEVVPVVLVDLDKCLIVLGRSRVHGPASGIELELEFAQLLTIERGLVTHERDFGRWDDALHAAALDPAALDLPGRR